ncbi:MAG: MvaI/BcnI family restriction endonuclease [candidate division KSB1 bacterium]|nr:MvaI/BcnI family restriction endonuclease [candidate division KSB1 bacterium]
MEEGIVLVDFDARSGHNHGTKFRIRQNQWHRLYESVEEINLEK